MLKKIALFPVSAMIFCSIVSLSSGLGYETHSIFFLIPVFFIFGLYYFLQKMISVEDERRERRICFLVTLGVSVLFSLLFIQFIVSGFENIVYQIEDRANACYSMGLIFNEMGQEEYVALTFFAITSGMALLSLWLLEKGEPLWITSVPSFIIFCVPLAVDGVPDEWSIVGYGASFLLLLILGKRGNLHQLIIATGMISICLLLGVYGNIWQEVEPHVTGYRHWLHEKLYLPSGTGEEEPVQNIDFGRFDAAGSVEYSGLTAMNIYSKSDLRNSLVYFRGYVGNWYENNQWVGIKQKVDDPMGLAFKQRNLVEMKAVADKSVYYCYVVNEEMPNEYQNQKIDYRYDDEAFISDDDFQITQRMKKQFKQEILGKKKPKTIGEAIEIVKKYLIKNCRYTLSPGIVQPDEMKAFLFYRKTGYCTHYATATVMMLRTMGVASRLVQGYMVQGDKIPKEKWTPVKDQSAHAWVEIYISGIGWYPFDATSFAVALPGQTLPCDAQTFEKKDDNRKAEADREQTSQPPQEKETVTPAPDPGEQEPSDEGQKLSAEQLQRRVILCMGIVFAAMVLIAACLKLAKNGKDRSGQVRLEKAYKKERVLAKRFLYRQALLEPYLESLEIHSGYESMRQMTERYEKGLGIYIQTEKEEEFRKETAFYVACCFRYRYGGEEMSEDIYDRCSAYLQTVFEALSRREEQKDWKKLRKCCIVDEVMNKKKKDR